MRKLSPTILCAVLLAALLLCGCSKSDAQSVANKSEVSAPSFDSAAGGEVSPDYPGIVSNHGPREVGGIDSEVLANRKIIRNAELNVETLEFDAFVSSMYEKVNTLGGYIQSNYVDSSDYSSGKLRTASTVVRIPAEHLDEFLSAISGLGNVTRREEHLSDVTDQYVDIEARLSSVRTEYQTLLDLLSEAKSLDETLQIQDRLTTVRYQLEAYETQLNNYDAQVDFSTVTLSVREVEHETVVTQETFGEETSRRFNKSLSDVGDFFVSFAKWLIGNLPHIIVVLAFVFLFVFVPMFLIKKSRKRRQEKSAPIEPQPVPQPKTENKD